MSFISISTLSVVEESVEKPVEKPVIKFKDEIPITPVFKAPRPYIKAPIRPELIEDIQVVEEKPLLIVPPPPMVKDEQPTDKVEMLMKEIKEELIKIEDIEKKKNT